MMIVVVRRGFESHIAPSYVGVGDYGLVDIKYREIKRFVEGVHRWRR